MFARLRPISVSPFTRRKSRLGPVDQCAVPTSPTWSVNQLLSSYPKPTLSDDTLLHLHKLSALHPPTQGTPEFKTLKADMEDMVRLVEAVKLVDTEGVQVDAGLVTEFSTNSTVAHADVDREPTGRALMEYAHKTKDGFYVVESDRQR